MPRNEQTPRDSAMADPGQRNRVWAWVIGLIVLAILIWVIARLAMGLQPKMMRPNATSNGTNAGGPSRTGGGP